MLIIVASVYFLSKFDWEDARVAPQCQSLVRVLGPVDRRHRRRQFAPSRLSRVPHYLEFCVRRLRPARVGEQAHRIDAVTHPLERVGAGEQVAWGREEGARG